MAGKKEQILQAALELFAREGFKGTPTSKVARHAGVSEGLIFRHFSSKRGLLEAILEDAEQRTQDLFSGIINEADPKTVIRKTIEHVSPGYMSREEREYWKLQYKIKWELEYYNEHKMKPLHNALSRAFDALGYDEPSLESTRLLTMIDGLATHYFLTKEYDLAAMISLLKKHYKV